MESFETTYWLAAAHFAAVAVAFALTAKPFVTTYHWLLLVWLLAFGVRPALAASVGGYVNYDSGIGWYAYNRGLLYQLVFMLSLSAAYVLLYRTRRVPVRPIEKVVRPQAFYILLAVGLLALGLLTALSGAAWLPGVRTGSINTVVPGGKLIFPFAVLAFSLLIPLGIVGCMNRTGLRWWVVAAGIAVALAALSLLFMRGMVIAGILLILWAAEKKGRLKARHVLLGLVAVFLIGQTLRPLGRFVAARYLIGEQDARFAVAAAVAESLSPMDRLRALLLFTTNLDIADSWPVVISYVEENGHPAGRTFLAVPARFASTRFRLASGYLTGSDLVNDYFYGAVYAEKSFGLQVTLANELFLNFGALGMLLGTLPGLATWFADSWLRRVRVLSSAGLFIAYICFRGFINELALTVQWALGALLLAAVVELLERLRIRKPLDTQAPPGLAHADS